MLANMRYQNTSIRNSHLFNKTPWAPVYWYLDNVPGWGSGVHIFQSAPFFTKILIDFRYRIYSALHINKRNN